MNLSAPNSCPGFSRRPRVPWRSLTLVLVLTAGVTGAGADEPEAGAERLFGRVRDLPHAGGGDPEDRRIRITTIPLQDDGSSARWTRRSPELPTWSSGDRPVLETISLVEGIAWITTAQPRNEQRLAAWMASHLITQRLRGVETPNTRELEAVLAEIDADRDEQHRLGPLLDEAITTIAAEDVGRVDWSPFGSSLHALSRAAQGTDSVHRLVLKLTRALDEEPISDQHAGWIIRAITFPFIFSPGTSGGTRSTDVVVVSEPVDATTRRVTYCLMHSHDESAEMPIASFVSGHADGYVKLTFDAPMGPDRDHLKRGEYVTLSLAKDGHGNWSVTNTEPIPIRRIQDLGSGSPLWIRITRAFDAACTLWMKPLDGATVRWGARQLSCPNESVDEPASDD